VIITPKSLTICLGPRLTFMLAGAETAIGADWSLRRGLVTDRMARRFCLASLGVAGTVLAHMAAYQFAYADPHYRSMQLAHTGHAYLATAATVALFGAIVALLGEVAIGRARPDRRTPAGTQPSVMALWMRLALGQVIVFATMEVAERALHGVNPSAWTEPSFWMALPVLLITAWLGALLLRTAMRLGVALARRRRFGDPGNRDAIWFRPAKDDAPTRLGHRSIRSRAPPAPLVV
jgi:hypothetical protein